MRRWLAALVEPGWGEKTGYHPAGSISRRAPARRAALGQRLRVCTIRCILPAGRSSSVAAGWVHAMADSAGKAAPGRRVDRTAQPEDLMMVLPAVPASVRAARTRIRHWLDCLACPLPVADDVELAVNEAIANVVDHAYPPDAPGQANLHAWVAVHPSTRQPRVVVAVTDHGRWAAHQPDTPTPAAHGHGLIVMSACMDELHIQRAASGTTVIMISASISATGRTPAAAPPPTPDT